MVLELGTSYANSGRSAAIAFGGSAAFAALVVVGLTWGAPKAAAIPSFARQTGQPCATCHNGAFPQLTPFGRMFKLQGYTSGGTRCRDGVSETGQANPLPQIPVSVMNVTTFTHTKAGQADDPTDRKGDPNGLKRNDNLMAQDTSIFFGGQIYCNLGAFVQATYDRASDSAFLDNTDIRYANTYRLSGHDLLVGVSINNNPSVEDVWNTSPAWRIPGGGWIGSAFAPGPRAPFIEGLGGKVAGASTYVFLDNTFYAAVGAYKNFDARTLQFLGQGNPSIDINGLAPYWRFAMEKNWGNYSFMVGTFGMQASYLPDVTQLSPYDKTTNVGYDAQVQYLTDKHFLTGRISYTKEWNRLDGSQSIGASTNAKNYFNSLVISGTYAYDARYSITLGYFNTTGSIDLGPGGPGDVSYWGSHSGAPKTVGQVLDIGYSPFSRGGPDVWPWLNTRVGVQVWHYDKIDGAKFNYDGNGRNAKDDDTIMLYAWSAF
jgi:hypothetical protein